MADTRYIVTVTLALIATTALLYAYSDTPATFNQKQLSTDSLKCQDRKTVATRAQKWIDDKVSYSQTTTHEGYRMDCSGYVSMSW